jgi:Flp pilus assembly protein TadB
MTYLILAAAVIVLVIIGSTAYIYLGANRESASGLSHKQFSKNSGASPRSGASARGAPLNSRTGRKRAAKKVVTLDEKIFQAGIFSDAEKKDFKRIQKLSPIILTFVMAVFAWHFLGSSMLLVGGALGFACGLQLPITILERKIKTRAEEIMYYLPLVIEQLVVGVSSSLDIGPCIQRVAEIADERGTHNCVTEFLKLSQYYVRSGIALPDALVDIGTMSGHNELKHTFLSLAQVVQHGGEVSKRLIEIADSVAAMRETIIEEKIKKLELVATGPVGLVFMAFMMIILVGFGLQMSTMF